MIIHYVPDFQHIKTGFPFPVTDGSLKEGG